MRGFVAGGILTFFFSFFCYTKHEPRRLGRLRCDEGAATTKGSTLSSSPPNPPPPPYKAPRSFPDDLGLDNEFAESLAAESSEETVVTVSSASPADLPPLPGRFRKEEGA